MLILSLLHLFPSIPLEHTMLVIPDLSRTTSIKRDKIHENIPGFNLYDVQELQIYFFPEVNFAITKK